MFSTMILEKLAELGMEAYSFDLKDYNRNG